MKQKILLIAVAIFIYQSHVAQTADRKYALGVNVVSTKYIGDRGGNAFTDFMKSEFCLGYFSGGLSITRYMSPSFDLGVLGHYGYYGIKRGSKNSFLSEKFEGSLFGHYKLNNGYILSTESRYSPFIALGVGMATYNPAVSYRVRADVTGTDFIVPIGAGLKYQLNEDIALQYKYLYNFTSRDNHDMITAGGNDAWGEHLFSIVFSIGKAKDSDKDGISDSKDLCPNTPVNTIVDEKGCPIDSDKDGVTDDIDKCPNTPVCEKVDENGCPLDSDKDGVTDYYDQCPSTPAGVKVDTRGCPIDSDQDGILDYLDKCPNTPQGTKVDTRGCPVVVVVAEKAPVVDEQTLTVFANALHGIQFKTGSHEINQNSYPILDDVVEVLTKNPQYKIIDICGHTDNVGADDYNHKLSIRRAEEVKKYLVRKGVEENRLNAVGFGETQPIETNETIEGRNQNRRVDFIVKFFNI